MKHLELHIISNGQQSIERFCHIASSIHEYVTYFHIRERTWTANEHFQAINLLTQLKVPLSKVIINDRIDVAITLNTAGVQLAFHSLPVELVKRKFPSLLVGSSVHSLEELNNVSKAGADFAIYGHIFETRSKQGLLPRGTEGLRELTRNAQIPVIAIGGIKPIHVSELIKVGASGVAVMSGVLEASDPLKVVKEYATQLHQGG
ncbi:thiamine phosphate synthase [Litchfieldia alkalitelluris]|uniref:thiamine phosphate synthase n=1 Tax=Litchfieldia alkalitelluris TaxID=304268 RepID=UPI0009979C47|nr:thiamine phosphate synthase [Litchfieldia alkalitelluris]